MTDNQIYEIVKFCVEEFSMKPKFEDLADYLPFLCAFGEGEFTRQQLGLLKNEIGSHYIFQSEESKRKKHYLFQENYEIILGLIEVYRLTKDESTIKLLEDIVDNCLYYFVWNSRITRRYYTALHCPSIITSLYCYSLIELLLDMYEITSKETYLRVSRELIYDVIQSPFHEEYSLFAMGDYLILRDVLNMFYSPKTCTIGKNTSLIFGMMKYAVIANDDYIKNKCVVFLSKVVSTMVKDGIVHREYQPKTNKASKPNLAAAFMLMNMLNDGYSKLQESNFLQKSMEIAERWIMEQGATGLFPFTLGDERSWLDSETDFSVSLLELYELTNNERYYQAAQCCYRGILEYNLQTSSVNIRSGAAMDPVNFKANKPTPKFLALFLKLAYYFESDRNIFGSGGIASLIRDR